MAKRFFFFLVFFVSPTVGFGFTFNVTATPESCLGNGVLSFTTNNADPNGTIVYEIFKLPNTTVPIVTINTNVFNGLSAGNYIIIAKETVGVVVTSQQQEATIVNQVVPLVINVESFNQACSNNSNIAVIATSGIAVSYEIFFGPVTFPLQTTNTFSGLPLGVYRIRVFDTCGTGVVSTFTLSLNPTGLNIGSALFTNTTPQSCSTTIANHTITPAPGTVIGYPLNIQFDVHPPGGAATQTFNSTLNAGGLTSQEISETIPAFPNQNYDYDVIITDSCGEVFFSNFLVNQNISLTPIVYDLDCNTYYFELKVANFTPPYTLNFINVPAGFNPINFNVNYPGPYNSDTITFGNAANLTPIGNYEVSITDVCGRSNTLVFNIFDFPSVPIAVGTNNGCTGNSGKIVVSIPAYKVVTATITSAPSSYTFPLPHDVSSFVDSTFGVLILDPLPLGDYVISVTNNCGDLMNPLNVTVPVYVNQGLVSEVRPGCNLMKSSVKISSVNTGLSTITITSAPPGFIPTLPYDGSVNIALDGSFYMNELPAGSYTFNAKDNCNFTNTIVVTIDGYAITNNTFSLQANCGSFDIPLDFVSNGSANQSFWLQKLINPTSNSWGHPATEIVYPDSSVPNASNSYFLTNNTTNFNQNFNGTFRIIRYFNSYNNGADFNTGTVTSLDKDCIEVLSPTLSFNQVLEITNACRMPCSGNGNLDVLIFANGALPIHYKIIEKDGVPFSFDNLNSNIFYNLQPAVYTFQLEDNCGNIVNRIFDVNTLSSLVSITQPNDILQCQDVISNNEVFDLTTQSAIILGSQSPTDFTLSYHESIGDAQNNNNPILNLSAYNPTTNPATIFARLVYNPLPNCYESIAFDLFVGENPKVNVNPTYLSCFSNPLTLNVASGNLPTTSYLWSDGSTNNTITVSQPGITNLTVTASNAYGANKLLCSNTKSIEVSISDLPVIDRFVISDWTAIENSITVFTSNIGSFEYSLDGINYQNENTFTNLKPGVYTVYVQDKFGCGFTKKDIWLLHYPNFFTPNDDGYNDSWFIENADFETDLTVTIFDRYGRLIKYLDGNQQWDGRYNGQQALSTDYWFVVNRQDGRTQQGHFTLKR
jgi:gliding motility-associated-like protein